MPTPAQDWGIRQLLKLLHQTPAEYEEKSGRKISSISAEEARGVIEYLGKEVKKQAKEDAKHATKKH